MKLNVYRSLWGLVDDTDGVKAKSPHHTYETALAELGELGYDGVEVPLKAILHCGVDRFKGLLNLHGLKVIVMVMTDGPANPGMGVAFGGPYPGFSEPANPGQTDKAEIVRRHLVSFKEQVTAAQEFNPTLVNSHSLKDYFTAKMAAEFFREALKWTKEMGFVVHHETHRKRFLHSPWATRDFLLSEDGPGRDLVQEGLTLVADLSHWVCVAETDCNDPDLTAVVEAVAPLVRHIHMRVGYDHGPQVPDPRDPAWLSYTEGHERWWDFIMREASVSQGLEEFTVTTEFGPPNYQVWDHRSGEPLADIWDVNHWIALRRQDRFAELFGAENTSSLKPSSSQDANPKTKPGDSILAGKKLGVDVGFL